MTPPSPQSPPHGEELRLPDQLRREAKAMLILRDRHGEQGNELWTQYDAAARAFREAAALVDEASASDLLSLAAQHLGDEEREELIRRAAEAMKFAGSTSEHYRSARSVISTLLPGPEGDDDGLRLRRAEVERP